MARELDKILSVDYSMQREAEHSEIRKDFLDPNSNIGDSLNRRRYFDEILAAVKAAHEAVINASAMRVVTTLKMNDRRDKPTRMETKMEAVK